MAKHSKMGKVDRSDPRKNKSLAIRTVLKKMPVQKLKMWPRLSNRNLDTRSART